MKSSYLGQTILGLVAVLSAPLGQAKEINMLFSFALPPYVIAAEGAQPAAGFELEIIAAALAAKGHTMKPRFVAMGAIPKLMREHKADAGQRGAPELSELDGYFYADEATVTYQDVAISLQSNHLQIDKIAQLKGKSVAGFQGASHFLGPEFAAAVKGNAQYFETSDEKRRIKQLYANGVQVYVGDINVFKFYKQEVKDVSTALPLEIHKIFTPSLQKFNNPVFRNKQVRDDFNVGLKQIKASAQYQKIIKKYLNE